MPPVVPAPTVAADDARAFEAENVHGVYDAIASHFSSTRYKPWPIIADFMGSLAAGSVGLDSGCGNGKYLALGAPDALTIGLDRSVNLLHIARNAGEHPRDVVLADALDDCWRPGAFDHAISIACLHHLATPERRRLAVEERPLPLFRVYIHPEHSVTVPPPRCVADAWTSFNLRLGN
ncbi:S-adenosyl-L-methionine-dependent methyltransferase [Exidia glandulosa HHB12029]|uniref:S-adenosyl-L-methionine-dependent methyltransferase n=1 Tax=Exidia glandulosa HHB12029 TaxID=1314781 RepID=A0A165F3G0_EXIGL|nr:S-adenosyl-L-methionine-dependent methyltransferase [Exidia glandulosa HHB12029]